MVFVCIDAGGSVPAAASQELARLSWAPPQDVPVWDINNCVLEDGQILITPEEEVHDTDQQQHLAMHFHY